MIKEAIDRIISLAKPNIHTSRGLDYADKSLFLIKPPRVDAVKCSTLQGIVDLHNKDLDEMKGEASIAAAHITSPTNVQLISLRADDYGRRHVWAEANYPECESFPFGRWLDPESFIIAAQQSFQRVKIETFSGGFEHDLDYVLEIASKISAEHTTDHIDDGFTQRVAVKQGVALKSERILKPVVLLAPYRTFAEIDQVLSQFVFRARVASGAVHLALYEGDGGRWKLGAVEEIKRWLQPNLGETAVIS